MMYEIGDVLAVKGRYDLVGKVVSVDPFGKSYKVDTGEGHAVTRYENEVVHLKRSTASFQAIQKVSKVAKSVNGGDPICQIIKDFINQGSALAQLFVSYVTQVSDEAIKGFLNEIVSKINVNVNVNVNIENLIQLNLIKVGV